MSVPRFGFVDQGWSAAGFCRPDAGCRSRLFIGRSRQSDRSRQQLRQGWRRLSRCSGRWCLLCSDLDHDLETGNVSIRVELIRSDEALPRETQTLARCRRSADGPGNACIPCIDFERRTFRQLRTALALLGVPPYAAIAPSRALMIASASPTMRSTSSLQVGMSLMRPMLVPADQMPCSMSPVS